MAAVVLDVSVCRYCGWFGKGRRFVDVIDLERYVLSYLLEWY